MRLYVLVEGQSEEAFINAVLTPHLAQRGLWLQPIIVKTSATPDGTKRKGGGRWAHWSKDLRLLTMQQGTNDVRFTTMFDLYGLPPDFPGLEAAETLKGDVRAVALEKAMETAVGDWRLIPYLQVHEFEALVLAVFPALRALLDPLAVPGADQLAAEIAGLAPEEINDGPETASSKRLLRSIPGYRKAVFGPAALQAAGLVAIRSRCPRFHAWLTRLEGLGSGP